MIEKQGMINLGNYSSKSYISVDLVILRSNFFGKEEDKVLIMNIYKN